jgi:transposase
MFNYSFYFKKIIIYFIMIYFINKENVNITYNFIYLNKTNDQT